MLDFLNGRLRAGDAWCWRDNRGVGIEAFEVECESALGTIVLGIGSPAGRPDKDVFEAENSPVVRACFRLSQDVAFGTPRASSFRALL